MWYQRIGRRLVLHDACQVVPGPVTYRMPEIRIRFDRSLQSAALHEAPPITALAAPIVEKVFEGRAAKVHITDTLRYPWGEERRDMAELQRIAEQLPGKPLTLLHPDDLIMRGAKARVVGRVESARIDGEYVIATFRVTDPEALEEIAAGVTDLSLGYLSHTDDEGYQRSIVVDHLAIVPRGRCKTCALRADDQGRMDCGCADEAPTIVPVAVSDHASIGPMIQGSTCQCKDHAVRSPGTMSEAIKMDEVQKQLEAAKAELDAVKGQLAVAKAKADQAELDRDNAKKDAEAATKKITDATAKADAAEAALKTASESHVAALEAAASKAKLDAEGEAGKAIDDKVELVMKAREILGADKVDSKAKSSEIKRAVITHVDGEDVPADKFENDGYIDGMYAGALKRADLAIESRKTAKIVTEETRKDAVIETSKSAVDSEQEAKNRMNDRVSQAWNSRK